MIQAIGMYLFSTCIRDLELAIITSVQTRRPVAVLLLLFSMCNILCANLDSPTVATDFSHAIFFGVLNVGSYAFLRK